MDLEAVEYKCSSLITCVSEKADALQGIQEDEVIRSAKDNASKLFPKVYGIQVVKKDNTTITFEVKYTTEEHPENTYGRIYAVILSTLVDQNLAEDITIVNIDASYC